MSKIVEYAACYISGSEMVVNEALRRMRDDPSKRDVLEAYDLASYRGNEVPSPIYLYLEKQYAKLLGLEMQGIAEEIVATLARKFLD